MRLSLRNICIVGITVSALIVINNLCKLFLPEFYATFIFSQSGMSISSIIIFIILAIHYITLCFYLFKKQYVLAGIVWIIQFLALIWYMNFIQSYNAFDPTSDYEQLFLNLKIKSFITIITGSVFIFSLGRKHSWLAIFGFFLIVSTLPIFMPELVMFMKGFYFYIATLIPLFLIINYYLELKNSDLSNGNNDHEMDVIDGDS
ncbi:MAG: hypothetical protein ACI8ZM_001535 [Crocinitomix sp.]|jgi:hypothetical protein